MKHSIDKQEKYVIVSLQEGKLDATVSSDLKIILQELQLEGVKNIIIDLKEVKYIDSSGLSALIVGNHLCKDAAGTMILCQISDHAMKIIKISQLNSVFDILPTAAEAIDAIFISELEKDFGKEESI